MLRMDNGVATVDTTDITGIMDVDTATSTDTVVADTAAIMHTMDIIMVVITDS